VLPDVSRLGGFTLSLAKTHPLQKPLAEKPPSLVYYFTGIVFYFHDVRYEALTFLVYLPYVGE
jgi:hypothetical protein